MSESLVADAKSAFKAIRVSLAVSGVLSLIAGIVLLVWPVKSAVIVTGIFATYLIIAGVVYVGLGIFSKAKGGWARVGHILLGLLYVVAGVIAFANLKEAALTLALITVIFIGVSWLFDGIVSLTLLGSDGSRVWTLLYAILSIVAGIYVLFNVLAAGLVLWVFLGVSLVVLGLVQIIRAFTLGRDAKIVTQAVAGE
ncbi:HdeD family acid-resistance protein [Microbacterium sp. NPDC057944]|uniref:HdeD family acid-resistance protein n=1 Tax=unclassified Microbacterium TaxID=2609290 RepID=UPI0036CBCA14